MVNEQWVMAMCTYNILTYLPKHRNFHQHPFLDHPHTHILRPHPRSSLYSSACWSHEASSSEQEWTSVGSTPLSALWSRSMSFLSFYLVFVVLFLGLFFIDICSGGAWVWHPVPPVQVLQLLRHQHEVRRQQDQSDLRASQVEKINCISATIKLFWHRINLFKVANSKWGDILFFVQQLE